MKKTSRVAMTPTLNRFKYLFDAFKSVTDNYMFIVDLKTHTALVTPNFAADFNLPGEVINNISDLWFPLIHQEEQPDYIMGFDLGGLADMAKNAFGNGFAEKAGDFLKSHVIWNRSNIDTIIKFGRGCRS